MAGTSTASAYDKTSQDGLPLLQMGWGWSFATQKDGGTSGTKKVWTPMMNFLVMNVEITNPEASGTSFNIKFNGADLQEINYQTLKGVWEWLWYGQ